MNTMYYYTQEIMGMYATSEEVDMEEETDDEMEIRFQEKYTKGHELYCECEECRGKTFDTWEDADAYAEKFWKKRFEENPTLKIF